MHASFLLTIIDKITKCQHRLEVLAIIGVNKWPTDHSWGVS